MGSELAGFLPLFVLARYRRPPAKNSRYKPRCVSRSVHSSRSRIEGTGLELGSGGLTAS